MGMVARILLRLQDKERVKAFKTFRIVPDYNLRNRHLGEDLLLLESDFVFSI